MPGPITVTSEQAVDPAEEVQQTQHELQKAYEDATKTLGTINPYAGTTGANGATANPPGQVNFPNGAPGDPGQAGAPMQAQGLYQVGQTGVPAASGPNTGGPDLTAIQNFLGQPGIRRYVQVVQNPQFLQDLTAFATHPKRLQLGYVELGWLIAIIMLKSYRMSKTSNWMKHIWISFSNFVLFWIGAFGFVPYFVIGDAYTKMITDAFRIYHSS